VIMIMRGTEVMYVTERFAAFLGLPKHPKFDAENVLSFPISSSGVPAKMDPEEAARARRHSKQLHASDWKVVLLCGFLAKSTTLSVVNISQQYELEIPHFRYQLYMENNSNT